VKPKKIYWRVTSTEEETRRVPKQPGLGKVLLPAALLIALLQSGCGGPYVFQQGLGQLDISVNRVPLDDESLQASLDEAQRGRMSWIPRVIEFARDELGLEPGDSYTSYFDTGGGPVSYTVVASHPLALIPYQWCFPLIGCVPYKGYFDPEDARAEALALRKAGWDAEVFPVEAYSTLGWFSDPLLSGMLSLSMPELVELLLHELTHRTLYIPSQSQLNEGFATHMGREGARLFFQRYPEAASRDELDEYHRAIERDSQYSELISRLKNDLDSLYRRPAPRERKLARKKELFSTATSAARELFSVDTITLSSNARVVASETYKAQLVQLARLQKKMGGHPRKLLEALREARDRGHGELEKLLEAGSI